MTTHLSLAGRTAVVTGAGSGIGRAISLALARRGCHVAICDINAQGLRETAGSVGGSVGVSEHLLDVADRHAVASLPSAILAAHGAVDILVNNAGVALGGEFEMVSEEDFDWLMSINFEGVVRMTRAFLPLLQQRPAGQVVNISSLFGLISPPGQTAYSAAKFAVRGFSQALRHELEASGSPVGVTLIHPGGIRTAIASSARLPRAMPDTLRQENEERFTRALRMRPERAGELIVRAIERRAPRVLIGGDAKVAAIIERLMPASYWRLLGRVA